MRKLGVGKAAVFGLVAALLAGCGGGTISDEDGGSGGGDTAPLVAALTLLSSAPQLSSDAADVNSGLTLIAVTKDASNNVLPGQAVSFAADSGAVIVTQPTTDSNGRALATLTTDGDPRNRTIKVTATSGSRSTTIAINVIGTTLSISGPANTQRSVETAYTLQLADAGGNGISGRAVELSTQAGNTLRSGGAVVSSVVTNGSGQASFTLSATNAATTITATVLGLTAVTPVTVSTDEFSFTSPDNNDSVIDLGSAPRTLTVTWLQNGAPVANGTVVNFSTTRGSLSSSSVPTNNGRAEVTITATNAGIANVVASSTAFTRPSATRSVRFRATQAAKIVAQADPAVIATNETSEISSVVRDANNNLVADKTVEFLLEDFSGGELSSPTAVTNTQGLARVTYRSTSTTTAKDGVRVTASARNADGSSATPGSTTLTVGSRALRITLGTGNEILEPNETTYQLPYSAIVTDAAGNPATNADFQLSVLPTRYYKGFYVIPEDGGDPVPFYAFTCDNEDAIPRNGVLDQGEDFNNSTILEPGNVATVPRSPDLDASGTVQFNIQYPQDRGNWVEVELTARAVVGGSEAVEKAVFTLPISEDDAENPPATFRNGRAESPYGANACDQRD